MQIRTVVFSVGLMTAVLSVGCKDSKEKACEHAYTMIKKCTPHLAGGKDRHLRVCQETFKKSSTKGTVECARSFSACDPFIGCLNFSARCADYEGDKFKVCLNAAPLCKAYKGKTFKACIKCIAEKHASEGDLARCLEGNLGEKGDGAPSVMAPTPLPTAKSPKPEVMGTKTAPAAKTAPSVK